MRTCPPAVIKPPAPLVCLMSSQSRPPSSFFTFYSSALLLAKTSKASVHFCTLHSSQKLPVSLSCYCLPHPLLFLQPSQSREMQNQGWGTQWFLVTMRWQSPSQAYDVSVGILGSKAQFAKLFQTIN